MAKEVFEQQDERATDCHRREEIDDLLEEHRLARDVANRPALLLADEPTGELDEDTGEQVADLFDRVHADGTSIVVVTHNHTLAARAKRRLTMKRGTVVHA